MEYLQIKNGEALQVTTHGNVEWDETHFCPASKLTPEEAALFDVHPLMATEHPVIDPITQSVMRNGCEQVDGAWRYRWDVAPLDAEAITANEANEVIRLMDVESARVAALWQGAYDYEFAQISGVAIGMLVLGVMQGLPKALAVKGWSQSIWTTYYTRKATGSTDADYSVIGLCPHSVPELMTELGL